MKEYADGKVPKNGDAIAWRDGESSERAFWNQYVTDLRSLAVVDPACGSGAFLVAAFDLLAAEYRRAVERLISLGAQIDFDYFDEIITKNLYGVDLNAESVEITRLALWLKTARREHRLQNLEATIKVGNTLVDDANFTDRPFSWRDAFPSVADGGGFDIVIGNPPYVRMELIKPIKPYLQEHYVVAADRVDLYAYFFERGVDMAKTGGRLGYISSSTFFRTGSGENLRKFLGDRVTIETVIDFGDLQLFEGVTTYPAIITLKKAEADAGNLRFLKIAAELPKDLSATFKAHSQSMPLVRLTAGSWQFEDDALARLRQKIVSGRRTLLERHGPPLYGIKTGCNEAFIVDRATRDRLIAADGSSAPLLEPFLSGDNVQRWRVESEGLFLINIPRGRVDIDKHPAIRDWLLAFKGKLEGRATKQEWFELQQAQLAVQPAMRQPKIVYPEFSQGPKFCVDSKGFLVSNKCFFVPGGHELSAYMNSRAAWFWLFGEASPLRGGKWRLELREQHVSQLPIPEFSNVAQAEMSELGERCSIAAARILEIQTAVKLRLFDFSSSDHPGRLTRKLDNWWELTFSDFRNEIKRAFKAEISVKERGEWDAYLAENAREIREHLSAINKAERRIDQIVYSACNLTADEIGLLEASLEGQY